MRCILYIPVAWLLDCELDCEALVERCLGVFPLVLPHQNDIHSSFDADRRSYGSV